MKLGMFMHPIHDFKRGYHTLVEEDQEVIKTADRCGFDEVWLGEHIALPSEPIQSPLMLMAALIHQTKKIKFGAGVLCLPNQHPAIVAGHAAQFDHMSKGRFMMGIGPGASPPDFELFGVLNKNRMEMLEESIDCIHYIWANSAPYKWQGKHWQFEIKDNVLPHIGVGDMGKPFQRPYPPVMIPAMSPNSAGVRVAARRGWDFISANFVPDPVVKGHWKDYSDECAKLGKKPDGAKWKCGRTLLITETDEEAEAYLKKKNNAIWWYFHYIVTLMKYGKFHHILKTDPSIPDEEVNEEYCIRTMVHAGSPRKVAKEIAKFRDESGPFETLIISHHDWVPKAMWKKHMKLVGTELMPRLRAEIGWQDAAE